jgi:S1-C subfamily serine protease
MIRFECPVCKQVYELPESQGGQKINCRKCQQRIQVPVPNRARTIMATELPSGPSAGAPPTGVQPGAPPAGQVPPPAPAGSYYCLHAGKRTGPHTKQAIKQMLKSGALLQSDVIWDPAMGLWAPLTSVVTPGHTAHAGPKKKNAYLWPIVGVAAAGAAALIVVVIGLIVAGVLVSRRGDAQAREQAKTNAADKAVGENAKPVKESPPKTEPPKELTPEEIVAAREKSVALIKSKVGIGTPFGTGFLVRDGIVATNYHVIELAPTAHMSVFFPSAGEAGRKPTAVDRVLFYDRSLDLALLAVKSSLPPVPLAPAHQFKRAESILVIGNPGFGGDVPNFENAVSRGIASTEVTMNGVNHYQLDITVNPGNSGGPVFNGRGEVIGVVKSKATKQERISFCIPVSEVHTALAKVAKESPQDHDKTTSRFNARVALRRINWSAIISDEGTIWVEKGWQDAITRKQSANVAIRNQQQQFMKTLNPFPRMVWDTKDISGHIAKIGTDPLLPEATRDDLAALWQNHEAMRTSFMSVAGVFNDYSRGNDDRIKRHKDLVGKLRITLGVDEEELKFPR